MSRWLLPLGSLLVLVLPVRADKEDDPFLWLEEVTGKKALAWVKARNAEILQDNCLHCHTDFVHDIVRGSTTAEDGVRCVHCHRAVGHGARG